MAGVPPHPAPPLGLGRRWGVGWRLEVEVVGARSDRNSTEKIKRGTGSESESRATRSSFRNDVHLRQLARKKKYVRASSFFLSAFLGVSRQGEFENTRQKFECVSKNFTGEIFFRGGGGLFRVDFPDFFFLSTFLLRWLSASR
jgi:hypothetical protein